MPPPLPATRNCPHPPLESRPNSPQMQRLFRLPNPLRGTMKTARRFGNAPSTGSPPRRRAAQTVRSAIGTGFRTQFLIHSFFSCTFTPPRVLFRFIDTGFAAGAPGCLRSGCGISPWHARAAVSHAFSGAFRRGNRDNGFLGSRIRRRRRTARTSSRTPSTTTAGSTPQSTSSIVEGPVPAGGVSAAAGASGCGGRAPKAGAC